MARAGVDRPGMQGDLVDIAIDNSVVSSLYADSDLLGTFKARLIQGGLRLVVSYPVLHETVATRNHAKAFGRVQMIVSLAKTLGSRFVLAGEAGRIVYAELATATTRSSTLSVPATEARQLLDILGSPDFESNLPSLLPKLQQHLNKTTTFENDKKARANGLADLTLAKPNDMERMLRDLRKDNDFWRTPFFEGMTDHGRYRQRMREHPRGYPAALTFATYSFLIAMSAIYGGVGYGKMAGVLKAPHEGDWVDAQIATCAAYSRFLLTEDAGQRKKIQFAAKEFPLRCTALSVKDWLQSASG